MVALWPRQLDRLDRWMTIPIASSSRSASFRAVSTAPGRRLEDHCTYIWSWSGLLLAT